MIHCEHLDVSVFYSNTAGDVSVSIGGSECTVTSVTDSEIMCTTGEHSPSVRTQVQVQIASNGIATQVRGILYVLLRYAVLYMHYSGTWYA
jgi:hypothetical protein